MAEMAYPGLGLMGRSMVRNLVKAGHRAHAWKPSAAELPGEIAGHSGFVAGIGE